MKIKAVVIIVYATIMLGCNKENVDNAFTGITSTNESGVILYADQDDWNFNDTWNQTEQDLFSESYREMCDFETISNGMLTISNHVIAYPNPCNSFFSINVQISEDARFVYRLVDSKYNILDSGEVINSDIKFDTSSLGFDGEIVRIYYKIFGENCELRGHGDIKIE